MAFTITDAELAVLIRAATDADSIPASIALNIKFLSEGAQRMILDVCRDAPDPIHNLALIRLVGYLYEQAIEPGGNISGYENAFNVSGAAAMLSRYCIHRAGVIEGKEVPAEAGQLLPPLPLFGDFILTSQDGNPAWVKFPLP